MTKFKIINPDKHNCFNCYHAKSIGYGDCICMAYKDPIPVIINFESDDDNFLFCKMKEYKER